MKMRKIRIWEPKKVGIKAHISRVRNELGVTYDLEYPYPPSIFGNLGGLSRHIQQNMPRSGKNATRKDMATHLARYV